ncbi:MAG: hypothetical protein IPK99_11220 [Flavobacteriales bacterium]|nr:hypothetical protein [Flavobacteriales bacterium]
MEFLSERVSMQRNGAHTSIVISPRLSAGKRTLLVTWTTAWTLCGAYILFELFGMPSGDQRSFTLAFMAFWTYFEIRLLRVVAWRLKGFELVRVKDGVITIKNSIVGYGRAHDFFIENIQGLGPLEIDPTSWKWQLNDSFWVIGGDRLGFEHLGKQVDFGKDLSEAEMTAVLRALKDALKRARRDTKVQ